MWESCRQIHNRVGSCGCVQHPYSFVPYHRQWQRLHISCNRRKPQNLTQSGYPSWEHHGAESLYPWWNIFGWERESVSQEPIQWVQSASCCCVLWGRTAAERCWAYAPCQYKTVELKRQSTKSAGFVPHERKQSAFHQLEQQPFRIRKAVQPRNQLFWPQQKWFPVWFLLLQILPSYYFGAGWLVPNAHRERQQLPFAHGHCMHCMSFPWRHNVLFS